MTQETDRAADATVPAQSSLEAQVNAPPSVLVALYHHDGRVVSVPEAAVSALLSDGWSRESNDIIELHHICDLLFISAREAVASYADEATAAAALSTGVESATFVAEHAMEDLVVAWGRLHRAIHTRLPVEQHHGGVEMRVTRDDPWNKAGDVVRVDESQVDAYTRDRGYELVHAAPETPEAPAEETPAPAQIAGQEGPTNAG